MAASVPVELERLVPEKQQPPAPTQAERGAPPRACRTRHPFLGEGVLARLRRLLHLAYQPPCLGSTLCTGGFWEGRWAVQSLPLLRDSELARATSRPRCPRRAVLTHRLARSLGWRSCQGPCLARLWLRVLAGGLPGLWVAPPRRPQPPPSSQLPSLLLPRLQDKPSKPCHVACAGN